MKRALLITISAILLFATSCTQQNGPIIMTPFEKHFQKVTSQVSRINSLLNNIDTLGKIEGMEMPFNPINQNLVERLVKMYNRHCQQEL